MNGQQKLTGLLDMWWISVHMLVSNVLCTVIGLTSERFITLGLPSWTHLRTLCWRFYTARNSTICFVHLAYGVATAEE